MQVGRAQTQPSMPPDYRGVMTRVDGVYVTPIAGAPFRATVEITSKQLLANQTEAVRTTVNHIARDSAGRIYNERRALVAPPLQNDPALLSSHIFDPQTRLNTYLDPKTHLAHQTILPAGEQTVQGAPKLGQHDGGQLSSQVDLGTQTLYATVLQGTRRPGQCRPQ